MQELDNGTWSRQTIEASKKWLIEQTLKDKEKAYKKVRLKNGNLQTIPAKRKRGNHPSVIKHSLIAKDMTYKYCQNCGSHNEIQLHHKNGEYWNHVTENTIFLCKECHLKDHDGNWRNQPKGDNMRTNNLDSLSEPYNEEKLLTEAANSWRELEPTAIFPRLLEPDHYWVGHLWAQKDKINKTAFANKLEKILIKTNTNWKKRTLNKITGLIKSGKAEEAAIKLNLAHGHTPRKSRAPSSKTRVTPTRNVSIPPEVRAEVMDRGSEYAADFFKRLYS